MYKKLSPQEYLVLKNEDMNWQLLDVREPWEIEIAHISGSLNIPINEINMRMNEIDKITQLLLFVIVGFVVQKLRIYCLKIRFIK